MKGHAIVCVLLVLALNGCDNTAGTDAGKKEVLVSRGFVDDNTYRVVCRGYPPEGLAGIQRAESSKRAALLGAYYFIGQVFNEAVAPDRDGRIEKIEYMSDHAVLHYVVTKKNLRRMVRSDPKPAGQAGPVPEQKAETESQATQGTAPESTIEVK